MISFPFVHFSGRRKIENNGKVSIATLDLNSCFVIYRKHLKCFHINFCVTVNVLFFKTNCEFENTVKLSTWLVLGQS